MIAPLLLAGASLRIAGAALAAEPPEPPGSVVDATRVLSVSTLAVDALGGAGIGFASGANGLLVHPAAPANRSVESLGAFTGTLAFNQSRLGITGMADLGNLGGGVEGSDIEGSGLVTNIGAAGAWRNGGMGVVVSRTEYDGALGSLQIFEGHVGGGAAYVDGKVAIGLGWHFLSFATSMGDASAVYTGSGIEAGVSLNRLVPGVNAGAVLRAPIRAQRRDGDLDVGINAVVVPWRASIGMGWYTPRATRPRPVRFAADLVVDGPVGDGLSIESVLDGAPRARGAAVTLTPRVGIEATLLPERIRVRAGSYLEPARVAGAGARLHGTAGLEVRLFHFDVFGIAGDVAWRAAVDVAPRYLDGGWLGLAFWQRGVTGTGWRPPEEWP